MAIIWSLFLHDGTVEQFPCGHIVSLRYDAKEWSNVMLDIERADLMGCPVCTNQVFDGRDHDCDFCRRRRSEALVQKTVDVCTAEVLEQIRDDEMRNTLRTN